MPRAGQGEQRGPLLLQQVRLDRGLAPEPPAEVRAAARLEVGVERLQAAAHGGDRDQEVGGRTRSGSRRAPSHWAVARGRSGNRTSDDISV